MALTQLAPPYPIFTDKSGDPLDNGYLYFGVVDLNPETNPIQVYYDSTFTQPVAQPIRTSNGYVMRNGAPALIYAGSQFSVTVRDKNSDLVIYSPVGYGIDPGAIAGVVVVQDQTGDGVTTAFGMGASPATENATNVFIDGVYQSKAGYSISGSTLTFSEAPPLYSAIEIVSNETSIVGGTGAQLVTYNEGGLGAVTRTVQSRLQDFVSVKDFGAVGDGVTDDGPAFNLALQAAHTLGKIVYVPAGEYLIDTTLVFDVGNKIHGEGRGDAIGDTEVKGSKLFGSANPMVKFVNVSSAGTATFGQEIIGCYLRGTNTGSQVGIQIGETSTSTNARHFTLRDFSIRNFNTNIEFQAASYQFEISNFTSRVPAAVVTNKNIHINTTAGPTSGSIHSAAIYGAIGIQWDGGGAPGISVHSIDFDGCDVCINIAGDIEGPSLFRNIASEGTLTSDIVCSASGAYVGIDGYHAHAGICSDHRIRNTSTSTFLVNNAYVNTALIAVGKTAYSNESTGLMYVDGDSFPLNTNRLNGNIYAGVYGIMESVTNTNAADNSSYIDLHSCKSVSFNVGSGTDEDTFTLDMSDHRLGVFKVMIYDNNATTQIGEFNVSKFDDTGNYDTVNDQSGRFTMTRVDANTYDLRTTNTSATAAVVTVPSLCKVSRKA